MVAKPCGQSKYRQEALVRTVGALRAGGVGMHWEAFKYSLRTYRKCNQVWMLVRAVRAWGART